MRWDDSDNGGFTGVTRWLPLEPPDGAPNVAGQRATDARSWRVRALMALRREHACLREGGVGRCDHSMTCSPTSGPASGSEILVALNIAPEPRKWHWQGRGRLLMSTHLDRPPQPSPARRDPPAAGQ